MNRRTLLATGIATALPLRAFALDTPIEGDGRVASDPTETVALWPGTPPGGEGVNLPPWRAHVRTPPALPLGDRAIDRVGRPQLDVFRADRPDGAAMINGELFPRKPSKPVTFFSTSAIIRNG